MNIALELERKKPPSISFFLPHRDPALLLKPKAEIQTKDPTLGDPEDKIIVEMNVIAAYNMCGDGHFPEEPIIMSALILETMQQAAALLALFVDWHQCNDKDNWKRPITVVKEVSAVFGCPVCPGDTVTIEVVMTKRKKLSASFTGQARVGDNVVCRLVNLKGAILPAKSPADSR